VLVVDDNSANRSVLMTMLQPIGFELDQAADGTEALTIAERFQPDLVLMDLRLPGAIDGLEATRRLRAAEPAAPSGNRERLRIIAVSASAYDIDRQDCREAGCDDFLAKPFREEELWDAIGRALGLAWQFSGSPSDAIAPSPLFPKIPPAPDLEALHELARKGDIIGLRTRAESLLAGDAALRPFIEALLELAARYKMKAIRQFLERHRAS
jgi:CheY-like chemotaxis protein